MGSSTTRSARQRNVSQRAPIRPRGGGRHKGAHTCEGGERDWDGVFCGSLAHLVPGRLLVGQQHHLRQKTRRQSAALADRRRRPR
eukprot:4024371-Prymnesium_polylepis.1